MNYHPFGRVLSTALGAPLVMKIIPMVVALLISLRGQAAPDGAQTVPELEALRGSYQRNMAAIAAARETRTAPLIRAYAADLDRLQKDLTARGDLNGALQVKDERERLGSHREPPTVEHTAMAPVLAPLRIRFEKDLQPVLAPLQAAEEQQKHTYLAALDNLVRNLTIQNQLDKASFVRTERDGIAGPASPKATPTPTPAATPTSIKSSSIAGAGQLDSRFAERIATAIRAEKLTLTELSRPKSDVGKETPSEGGVLVGFEFFEQKSNGIADVRALRPIYLTRTGIKEGADRGKMEKVTNKVMARPGYAVGGIQIYHTNNTGTIQGIQVIFMAMNPGAGRLEHDSNTYRSLWFGSFPRKEKPKVLGGDGHPVVGVYGLHGDYCDCLGLIQMAD
jgi:hypothetical protein